jgi:CRISPR-associated endonuclease/helicase Cas3
MQDKIVMYAKVKKLPDGSYETEDVEGHTEKLLENLELLQHFYKGDIERAVSNSIWEALKICVLFHDLGKCSPQFQNKLRQILGLTRLKLDRKLQKEIPHNFLSVAFLPEDISPSSAVFYAIANHHSRPIKFGEAYLKEVVALLGPQLENIRWVEKHGYKLSLWDEYFPYLGDAGREKFNAVRKKPFYIALKGLLHRLDYSSSAGVPAEVEMIEDPAGLMVNALKQKARAAGVPFSGLKPFQTEAEKLRGSNVILAASTGIGKTEFAVNWLANGKGFYTLPLRVSVDAMYDRMRKMFGQDKVGLLHGGNLFQAFREGGDDDKAEEDDNVVTDREIREFVYKTTLARQLSMPLTVTTADQLFTAAFKWNGYEQIYSTLMYSKIILDEPQAYSPEILATIVTALQEITALGGRFCIMSATLHPFITEELKKCADVVEMDPVYNTELKHRLRLADTDICGLAPDIEKEYKSGKKVLVICNTVKKSQEIYGLLKDLGNVHLLHAGFIVRDRALKEKNIKKDYKKDDRVIWITTQIVEASLDIDYDMLFTELSTIDALIQRMGRVFRRRGRVVGQHDPANIVVACKDPSDNGYIYAEELVGFTREALSAVDGMIIPEEVKAELMAEVFNQDRVKTTDLYRKFLRYRDLLVNGFEAETKREAQDLFRRISNATVIPVSVYEDNMDLIDSSVEKIRITATPLAEKMGAMRTMRGFTVDIPLYRTKGRALSRLDKKGRFQLIEVPYGAAGVDFRKDSQFYDVRNIM